ncbi:MAG: Xaa-Pro peptidase family protein [Bacillota bacterium]|nr:Xaa-Pro peptidase family protein [Bacillota bacterium]
MDASKRIEKIRSFLKEENIGLSIITNPDNQYYLSGFLALIYSRPIILTIDKNSKSLIIPALEENHAKEDSDADNILVYYEHPELKEKGTSYLQHLDTILDNHKENKKIAVEFKAMPIGLAEYLKNKGFELIDISDIIKEMRYIKDEQEMDLLEKSGELVSLAVAESIKNLKPGISEIEFDSYGDNALYAETAKRYPNVSLFKFQMSPSGIERTNMPHVFSNTRKFKDKDIIIHSRQVGLNNYHAECERTIFIGEPSEKQKKVFKVMVEAQATCMGFIKPGVMAKEVDEIGRKIIQEAGYGEYAYHRIGHGIGIGSHEEPYLRFDSELIIKEGMVFSIEPGIYIPGIGGFRHSDTIVITKDGSKIITDFPRELEELIF